MFDSKTLEKFSLRVYHTISSFTSTSGTHLYWKNRLSMTTTKKKMNLWYRLSDCFFFFRLIKTRFFDDGRKKYFMFWSNSYLLLIQTVKPHRYRHSANKSLVSYFFVITGGELFMIIFSDFYDEKLQLSQWERKLFESLFYIFLSLAYSIPHRVGNQIR